MTARIICIGNRQVGGDEFGPLVYDQLASSPLPAAVEIIDGGLAGLGLLRYLEDGHHVVFVDAVAGFGKADEIVLLSAADVASQSNGGFDHAAGLPYLLKVLPAVLEAPPPHVDIVGYEGTASMQAVRAAARYALHLATEGAADVREF